MLSFSTTISTISSLKLYLNPCVDREGESSVIKYSLNLHWEVEQKSCAPQQSINQWLVQKQELYLFDNLCKAFLAAPDTGANALLCSTPYTPDGHWVMCAKLGKWGTTSSPSLQCTMVNIPQ